MVKSVHYFINLLLDTTYSSVNESINIPFIPSRVIVKSVVYYPNAPEIGVSLIRCDKLVDGGGGILCQFSPYCNLSPNSSFHLNKPINGAIKFEILDINGNLLSTRQGDLSIDLEFME